MGFTRQLSGSRFSTHVAALTEAQKWSFVACVTVCAAAVTARAGTCWSVAAPGLCRNKAKRIWTKGLQTGAGFIIRQAKTSHAVFNMQEGDAKGLLTRRKQKSDFILLSDPKGHKNDEIGPRH